MAGFQATSTSDERRSARQDNGGPAPRCITQVSAPPSPSPGLGLGSGATGAWGRSYVFNNGSKKRAAASPHRRRSPQASRRGDLTRRPVTSRRRGIRGGPGVLCCRGRALAYVADKFRPSRHFREVQHENLDKISRSQATVVQRAQRGKEEQLICFFFHPLCS